MVKDPVCGMELEPAEAAASLGTDVGTFYFCSVSCSNLFAKRVMAGPAGRTSRVMDPVCGMRLEPSDDLPWMKWGQEKFWFCSEACHAKFRSAPSAYLHPREVV